MLDKRTKQAILVTALGVSLYVGLMNLPTVFALLGELISLIQPVIVGGILALFIHVPMNGIQKRLKNFYRKRKKQLSDKSILIMSFLVTVICVLLVLALVLVLLIPELVTSSQRLYDQVVERLQYLEGQNYDIAWLEEIFAQIDFEGITQKLSDAIDGILPDLIGALSSAVGVFVTAGFALIISIYISLGKENLCRHCRKLVVAYLPECLADGILIFS